MRPVARPALPDAYRTVQEGIQDECESAQETYIRLLRTARRREYYKSVVRALPKATAGQKKANRKVGRTALKKANGKNLDQLVGQLDGFAAKIGTQPPTPAGAAIGMLTAKELAQLRPQIAAWSAVEAYYRTQAKAAMKRHADRVARRYPKARGPLITGIGQYCSYCEMPMTSGLAIEHTVARSSFPEYGAEWTNFLLACAACNSAKGSRPAYEEFANATFTTTAQAARAAAVATLRTPADTDYVNAGTEFRYELSRVVRLDQTFVFEEALRDTEVYPLISQNLLTVRRADNGTLMAETSATAYSRFALTTAQVTGLADFSATTWNGGVPQSVAVGGLPDTLREVGRQIAEFGTWSVPEAPTGAGATLRFRLDHSVTYRFSFGPQSTSVTYGTADWEHTIATPGGTVRRHVTHGVLAAAETTTLGHRFFPSIEAVPAPHSAGTPPSEYDVTITDRYWVRLSAGDAPLAGGQPEIDLEVRAVAEAPIELRLLSATPTNALTNALDLRRRSTVRLLDLNSDPRVRVDNAGSTRAKDLERTMDRRVFRRTLTWWTATQSIRRAVRAAQLAHGDLTQDAGYQMVLRAVADTAAATGCWTLWGDVVTKMLATATDAPSVRVRDDLRERLRTDYPGTRFPA
ncbi:HNH endonuclease [Frankia sp. R82]|uniref:HNH endonuclease n=1 Tax=Frankia sp. R82 TaxID=2950553 RepID=UPI0020445651|nr:hypothetical protein [Frankia sp. R82]MCM3883851.1 hypothetical protein [Frankia sp. R82]